ncbi:MAG: hypothetical protein WAN74_00980 [Thermoplasmata archaeon]
MTPVTTVAEALRTIHPDGPGVPRTVVTRGPNGTLIALGIFGPRGTLHWQGLWIAGGDVQPLGGPAPRSVRSTTSQLSGPTALLVDLIEYAWANYTEHLVELDERIASWPTTAASIPIAEMEGTYREVAEARRRVIRLVSLVSQLGESLGASFPEIGAVLPEIRSEAARQEALCTEIQGVLRDLVLLRTSQDGNRISESAVELGKISNQISALANTSNIRMLGIAYLALVIALIGAVVLIPNTTATILGMPSASWVSGFWVVVIVAVTAIVPLVIVFSRPWVLSLMRGLRGFERTSREGLQDLPEISATAAASTTPSEPLLPRAP